MKVRDEAEERERERQRERERGMVNITKGGPLTGSAKGSECRVSSVDCTAQPRGVLRKKCVK